MQVALCPHAQPHARTNVLAIQHALPHLKTAVNAQSERHARQDTMQLPRGAQWMATTSIRLLRVMLNGTCHSPLWLPVRRGARFA
jgi:hypothetical protein